MIIKSVIDKFVAGISDSAERARAIDAAFALPYKKVGTLDAVEISDAKEIFAQARVDITVLFDNLGMFFDRETLVEMTQGLQSLTNPQECAAWAEVRKSWEATLARH